MLIGTDNFKVCLCLIPLGTVLTQTTSKNLCVVYFTGHSPGTDNIKEFVLFISQVTVLSQTTSKSLCCLFHRPQSWHRQHQRVCVVYFTGHSPGTDNIKEFVLFISQVTVLAQTTSKSLCCLFHRSQSWHRQHQRVCVVYFTGHSPGTDNIKEFVCCLFHRSQSWHRQHQRVCVIYFTGHSPGTDNIKEFVCCLFHRPQSWHRQHQRVCVVYFTGHSPGTDNIKEFVLFISQVTVLAQTTSKSLCCLFHRPQSWHRQHQRVCVVYFTGHSPGTDNIKEFVLFISQATVLAQTISKSLCYLFHRSQSWHRQYQRVCVIYFTGHSPGTDNIKEFVLFISPATVLAQTTSKSLCYLFHRSQSWHRQYQRVCVIYFTGHSPGTDNIKEFVLFISQVTVLAQTISKSLCYLFHRSQSWHRQYQRVCVIYFTGHSPGTDNIKEFVLFISQVTVLAQTISKSLCYLFHRPQSWHRQYQRVCVIYFTGHSPGTDNIKEFVLFISQATVLAQTTSKSLCCLFHRPQSWHRQHQRVCVVYFTGHSPGTDNIKEFVLFISQVTVLAQTTSKSLCCLFHRSQSWHRQHQRVCVVYFTGHSPGTDNIKEFVLFISQATVLAQTTSKSLCCLFHRPQSWHRQHQRVCVIYFTGHSPGTDNIKEFVLFISQATVLAQTISKSLCYLFHRSQSWHRQHQRVCVVYFTGHSPGTDNIKEFVCCLFHRSQSWHRQHQRVCVIYFTGHSPGTDNIKEFVLFISQVTVLAQTTSKSLCCLFHRPQSWHRQHQRVCVVYFTGHSPGTDNIKEFVLFISQATVLAQTISKSLCYLFHRPQSWHRQYQRVCVIYFTGHSPGTDNIKEFVLFISQVTVLAQTISKSLCYLFHRPQSWHRQYQRVCVIYFTGHSPGTDNIKEFVLFISQATVLAQTTSKSLCVVYFTGHSPGTDNIKEFVLFISQVTVLAQTTSKSLCYLFHRSQSWHRQHQRVCVVYFTGHSPGTDNIKEFVLFISQATVLAQTTSKSLCCLFHRPQSWHRQYQRVCVIYFTGHSPGTDNIKEFVLFISQATVLAQTISKSLCYLFHRSQSWHRQYQRVCVVYFTGHSPGTDNIKEFVLFISQATVLAQTTSKSLCYLFHRPQSWHRQYQRVCVIYFTGHSPGTDNIKEFVLFISQATVLAQTISKSLCYLFHRPQSWHRQHKRVCVVYFTGHSPGTDNIKEFVLFISQATVLAQTTSKSLCCLFHRSQSWHRQHQRVCVVYFTGHSPGTDNIKEFVCCLFHRSQSWHRQHQRVCVVYFTGHSPGTDNIKEFVLFISQATVLAQTTSKSLCCLFHRSQSWHRQHQRVCVVYFTGHSPGTDNIKEFVLFISQATVLAQTTSKSLCYLFHRPQSWHRQHQRVCVVYFTGHSPGTDNIKEFVLFISQVTVLAQTTSKSLCCLFHRPQSWHRQHQRVCVVYFTGHSPGTDNIKEFVLFISQATVLAQTTSKSLCCLFHRPQSWHRQHQRVCVVYFTGHSPGTDNIKEFVLFISQVTVLAQTTSKSLCCLFHRPQSWHRQHHRVCVIYFTGHSPGTDNIKEFVCCLFHRSQSWHRQYQRVCVLFISQVTVLAQTISKSLCVVYFTGHSPGTNNIKEFVCCLFHRSQS